MWDALVALAAPSTVDRWDILALHVEFYVAFWQYTQSPAAWRAPSMGGYPHPDSIMEPGDAAGEPNLRQKSSQSLNLEAP